MIVAFAFRCCVPADGSFTRPQVFVWRGSYTLDLGPIDLCSRSTHRFALRALPAASSIVGLGIEAARDEIPLQVALGAGPGEYASVGMRLAGAGVTLWNLEPRPIAQWVWSSAADQSRFAFVYCRDRRPDDGRLACGFRPRRGFGYRLDVEIVPAADCRELAARVLVLGESPTMP